MNKRINAVKTSPSILESSLIAATATVAALALAALPALAQDDDNAPVAITAPSAWSTLRSDSLAVSVQAELSKLPKGSIDFKVVKRSGARSSTLFSKNVKMNDASIDTVIGRVTGAPIGGSDYLSIEWSVPGSELKGVIEPVGIAKLAGTVSADNKWIPAQPPIRAIKLLDKLTGEQAAETLSADTQYIVGGARFIAGWNAEALFVHITPGDEVTEVELAFDLKYGANAFVSWADRFVTYSVPGDSIYGRHAAARSVGKEGAKFEESPWGSAQTLALSKSGASRLIKISWPELGMQPFEERSLGFAILTKGKTRRQPTAYPSGANRAIPGTWGGLILAK